MPLFNDTPFSVGDLPVTLPDGRNVVAIVIKGTFVRLPNGTASLAASQRGIRMADEHHDDGGHASSVKRPSDHCAQKHGADVLVIGDAQPPSTVRVTDVAVSVREHSLALRVHGERLYEQRATGVAIGEAIAFDSMPVCYERCYGGQSADLTRVELRNPVGRGVATSARDLVGTPAPQIEEPAFPIRSATDAVEPICFGPIPSSWMPRAARFGTCDVAWQQHRMPLPPLDYDVRAENAAHPKLQLASPLQPGEVVGVRGMSRHAENWTVSLPPFSVRVAARYADGRRAEVVPAIDTLLLEPNDNVLELTMRAALPIRRGRMVLREVAVRHG